MKALIAMLLFVTGAALLTGSPAYAATDAEPLSYRVGIEGMT